MRVGFIIALFLVMLSLSFATFPGPGPHIEIPELGLGFILLIVLLSVMIISFSSMAANSFQSPELMAWSKTQITEVTASVILVVIIWAGVFGSNIMVSAIFLDTGQESLADLGATSLDGIIEYQEILYGKVAQAYLTVGALQGTSYHSVIAPAWWIYFSIGGTPLYGLSILLGPLSIAASNLTTQILLLKSVQAFMQYIDIVVPLYVLPLGLAFRILPFTRNVGNTLIALSLGALFMLPLSLMLVGEFYAIADSPDPDIGFEYKKDVEGISFEVDEMAGSVKMFDVGKIILGVVCKNSVLRTFAQLGELIWGLVYGLVLMSTCPEFAPPYLWPLCVVKKFIVFIFDKWPDIMFYAELAFATIMTPAIIGDLTGAGGAPDLHLIVDTLLPAVTEAVAFSLTCFFIIVFVTFGGVRAISAALGGDQIMYGLSRFV